MAKSGVFPIKLEIFNAFANIINAVYLLHKNIKIDQ
jgi:hypothetical protein